MKLRPIPSQARRPKGRRTVLRWASNLPSEKKNKAMKTPTENQPNYQAPGRFPASQAEMPSMRTKSETRKEALDPTRSLASPRHLVRST
ncbi:hypothetical protein ElyMa_001021800 [Elysia marginata]|uniref:Uncharacterized protein n=1 Tax=Elysia marginata TaxID=1093978 RepID=A0AAV4HL04_9GAST|nr:hypothetical protein ElyMa_001021800 [Elysia marginata]